ncbi:hypothetical protein L7F22_050699 [Adiantum nelumboides]|nr:hypothetical protein [Adiantum nelumboides]
MNIVPEKRELLLIDRLWKDRSRRCQQRFDAGRPRLSCPLWMSRKVQNCKYFGAQMHLLLLSLKGAKINLKSHVIDVICAHQTFHLQRLEGGYNLVPMQIAGAENNSLKLLINGGRCTDGVGMTLRWESNCLYVLLDFKSLGSFERREQEDMFLSVLNAAISITICNRKDFHLDKETEALFQQFQDGGSLVKTDDKLFKGLFYMEIKDMDASDVDNLENDFIPK